MSDAKFKMTGQRELVDKLKTLDKKMRRSISGKALRAGAKVTVRALRSAAPKDTGRGAKALGTKVKTYRASLIGVAITGERVTKVARGKEKETKARYGSPHFHLIEYGTGERFKTGEKKAREFAAVTSARAKSGKADSAKYVQAALSATGSFGRSNPAKFSRKLNLRFATTLRDVQSRINRNLRLKRFQKGIAADYRSGRGTGRVRPKPFFQRAWRSSVGAMQAAQIAVLKREIEAAARGG